MPSNDYLANANSVCAGICVRLYDSLARALTALGKGAMAGLVLGVPGAALICPMAQPTTRSLEQLVWFLGLGFAVIGLPLFAVCAACFFFVSVTYCLFQVVLAQLEQRGLVTNSAALLS